MTTASLLRLFLLAAVWGGSFLFMRIAAPTLGAVNTAFGRVVLGTLGLLGVVGLMRVALRFRGLLLPTLTLGALNSGVPFLMFAYAASALPAGYSAILNATAPLMGAVIGRLAFGERLTKSKMAGVAIGLLGVAVLTRIGPVQPSLAVLLAVGACLIATAFYGLTVFLTRRWITQQGGLDSRLVALGSQAGAAVFLLPVAIGSAWLHPVDLSTIPGPAWGALLALGLLCTALAYVLYFRLIADVGPIKALSVTFLIPVFGVLWGWLFLDEAVTIAHAVGAGLIGVALWLVLQQPAPRQP